MGHSAEGALSWGYDGSIRIPNYGRYRVFLGAAVGFLRGLFYEPIFGKWFIVGIYCDTE